MQVDFSQKLVDINGKPIMFGKEPDTADFTLKLACIEALFQDYPDEQAPGSEKFKRALLGERIHASNAACEVSAEEISQIKERIGRKWPPIIVLPAFKLLEGGKIPPAPEAA